LVLPPSSTFLALWTELLNALLSSTPLPEV
jgi:hypothetical protein